MQASGKRPLREGTKQFFVAQHLDKTAEEIIAAAKAAKIKLSIAAIHQTRSILKTRYGITKPIHTTAGMRQARGLEPETAPVRRSAPPPPLANGNGHAVKMNPKEAQLRRLIFEMGFDAARKVFDEFNGLHERLQ